FIAFRWIPLSRPLFRWFLLVMRLLLMPTLIFFPLWCPLRRFPLFPYTPLFRSLLEFDVVFMVGMEDGVFPHYRSMGDAGELEERSEEHTSELQSLAYLVCRLLLEKNNIAFRWLHLSTLLIRLLLLVLILRLIPS